MPETSNLILLKDSRVLFSVFRMPPQGAEEFIEPADELITYLEKSFGQPVPQYDETLPIRFELRIDPAAELENEEFVISCSAGKIVLYAATRTAMFHAVYFFLEKALGIRWLWPGESGDVVPKHENLTFPCGEFHEKPDFKWRAMQTQGAIYGFADGIDWNTMRHAILKLPLVRQREFELWCRRNRLGGLDVADGHRWGEIAPTDKYGLINPDIYAIRNGQRDNVYFNGKHYNQPCLSNKGTARLMAEYACARFKRNPRLDACSIAMNDGPMECECDECASAMGTIDDATHLDEITNEIASTPGGRGYHKNITDLLFENANQAARLVVGKFPGRKLLILLYGNSRFASEKQSLSKDVIGQFCVMGNLFWNEEIMRRESELLDKMSRCVPELGIYEYYSNGQWPEIFRLFPNLVAKTINIYYDKGARYFSTQPGTGFAINGLNYYFLAKLLWDRKMKPEEILHDYCVNGFGAAATEIKKYFTALATRWQQTHSGTKLPGKHVESRLALGELYSEKFLDDRENELAAALKIVSDKTIARRIKFLHKGLTYCRLYCRAARDTSLVYKAIDSELLSAAATNPQKLISSLPSSRNKIIKKALNSWNRYWNFVRRNTGKFIFDDFWVNYRCGIEGAKDPTLLAMKEKLSADKQIKS